MHSKAGGTTHTLFEDPGCGLRMLRENFMLSAVISFSTWDRNLVVKISIHATC